ncbi:MAG: holin family protein [Pseudomonadota bacterium]
MDITGLGGIFDFAGKVIDRLIPDPQAKLDATQKLLELQQSGELAQLAATTDLAKGQLDINKIEAASTSLFVSGWRPFIGWICGIALGYHFILQPLLAFIITEYTGKSATLPIFDMSTLSTILMGLLGLGGMRTFEKIKGISK